MLPRIDHQTHLPPLYGQFVHSLKANRFTGDVNASYSARLAVATDNSVYQQLPQLVIHPRTQQDVVIVTQVSNEDVFNEIGRASCRERV